MNDSEAKAERRLARDGIANTAIDVVQKAVTYHREMVETHTTFVKELTESLEELGRLRDRLEELEAHITQCLEDGDKRGEVPLAVEKAVNIRQDLHMYMHQATMSLIKKLQPSLFLPPHADDSAGAPE